MSNKPVFFDASGKRQKIVDFILVFILLFTIISGSFLLYYLNRISTIQRIVETTEKTFVRNNTALLYTESSEDAYRITGDQIQDIGNVLVPKYLATEDTIATTVEYSEFIQNIETLSSGFTQKHNNYFILSSRQFSLPPAERTYNKIVDAILPTTIEMIEMKSIVENTASAGAKGLFIDFDIRVITSEQKAIEFTAWLNAFKELLHAKNLELGLSIAPTHIQDTNVAVLSSADLLYAAIDPSFSNQEQVDSIIKNLKDSTTKLFIQVPTHSTLTDSREFTNSTVNIAYKTLQEYLLNRQLGQRGIDAFYTEDEWREYRINDAVTSYNFINNLKNNNVLSERTSLAIADPGIEEYTTWSLIEKDPSDVIVPYLLSEDSFASLTINEVGDGEIYSIQNKGVPGKRIITFDDNKQVISSTITTPDQANVVLKEGSKPSKVALTFDDGPSPEYTTKVMDILEHYQVRGTFFVIGEKVLQSPDVARQIVTRGHEIENHSYTHPIFSNLSPDATESQLQATNRIIQEITGQTPSYFRKPYSDRNTITSESDIEYLELLKKNQLSASEYDIDSKDWLLDSSEAVVSKVKNDIETSENKYSQILLHDAHQNTERTLEALPKIIEYLQANNIEIVTVANLDNDTYATTPAKTPSFYAVKTKSVMLEVVTILNVFFILGAFFRYAWILFGSIMYRIKYSVIKFFTKRVNIADNLKPKLAIIIACYNEEKVIGRTIESLLSSSYNNFRLIIVNDGSKDNTAEIIQSYAQKDRRITFIDVPNGGKAKALETALLRTKNKWLVFCDADTLFSDSALNEFATVAAMNQRIGAVAGKILVGNDNNFLTRSQVIEYGIAHIFTKSAQDVMNMITVVPGAAGMWQRKALLDAGGFMPDTLAEDADTTMRVISMGYRIKYQSTIEALTEAPEKMRMLYKQRTRWQLGNMQSLIKHRRGLFSLRYGALGFIGLPLFVIDLFSTIFFPIILLFTGALLVSEGALNVDTFTNIFSQAQNNISILLGLSLVFIEILLSIIVIAREKKPLVSKIKLLVSLPYYLTVYKAFLSYCTIVSLMRALRGKMQGWGHLQRTATVKVRNS